MKQITKSKILSNTAIARDVFRMDIIAPKIAEEACPGQFVNLYTGCDALLLPRPVGIADVNGDTVTLVYSISGKGTLLFSGSKPSDMIEVLGPNGNGFTMPVQMGGSGNDNDLQYPGKVLLVGGGLGIPPLLFAARRLCEMIKQNGMKNKFEVTALLGFREEPWLLNELKPFCQNLFTISEMRGGRRGTVMDLLDYASISAGERSIKGGCSTMILACGPKLMLKAVCEWAPPRNIPVQVSMEERMGCGTGVCVGCTCRVKGKDGAAHSVKICTDGPVFWGSDVIWQ